MLLSMRWVNQEAFSVCGIRKFWKVGSLFLVKTFVLITFLDNKEKVVVTNVYAPTTVVGRKFL